MKEEKIIVNSWNEWDPLKHVIVGKADETCIPAPEPALDAKVPEDSDMRRKFGPRSKDAIDQANQLLDDFSNMLIKKGIKVFFGHHRKNINKTTMVVISSAVKKNNVELISAKYKKLPIFRRGEMLANIVALKKNIVVKLHPKERKEGLYEEVFGTDTYGDKWFYSDIHPFVLGKESAFAISFYSGVPIDMLALGVPTIEYLDLRGIPDFDNDESLRDKKGHPCFGYRYLDLVLGASDYDQMKAHAMEIMNDRETVLSRLQAKYNELFPQIENINEKIAKDILSISSKGSE